MESTQSKRLSLIFPSWYTDFGSYKYAAQKVSTFPPLNLCIVGTLAELAGWEVQLIDAHIEQLGHKEIANRVKEFNPQLIGLTATTPFYHTSTVLAKLLKETIEVPILMGGTHVTVEREKAFENCFDYLFVGECEKTFPDFLNQFSEGERLPNIKGILMRDEDGKIIYHGEAPVEQDLDKFSPARHLLPNEKYFLGTKVGKKQYTSVQTQRGCPFRCSFCASDLHGIKFRRRTVASVISELDHIVNKLGINHIYFIDDTFTQSRKWVLELCDEIERNNLKFTFEGGTRAELWNEQLVQRLKKCGLVRMSFGLESADLEVRKLIRKTTPLETYITSNRLSNKYDIDTTNSTMIGLPGDTRESIKRTIDFVANSKDLLHVAVNIAIPYPGTEMYNQAVAGQHGLKLLETDWSKYQRYGSGVMTVNGITPQELVKLQRNALIKIYSKPWRFVPIIKRLGFFTTIQTSIYMIIDKFVQIIMPRTNRLPFSIGKKEQIT